MCTINDNHMIYGSWDMKYNRHNCLLFLTAFCPFTTPHSPPTPLPPLTTHKFKIIKRWKKNPGDIILHNCTINDNHMMYGSWDMEQGRHNSLLFWNIFCLFTSLTNHKTNILKKWKTTQKILSFSTCVP